LNQQERNIPMATAYIVDAVRTAGGKRGGRLAGVHPVDLGAAVFDAIADRNDFDTKAIDDVITGCVSQGGQQTMDLGRNAVLASNLPDSIPAVTIDRPVRLVAAGDPVRRAGGDVGNAGHRARQAGSKA
jgi:hypothetical protein